MEYFATPLFIDRRGAVADVGHMPIFRTWRVEDEEVIFAHPARQGQISVDSASLIAAGEENTDLALAHIFAALKVAGVSTVSGFQLRKFWAFPDDRESEDLAALQRASMKVPFEVDDLGKPIDFAFTTTFRQNNRVLNFQYGPMERAQWVSWGGSLFESVSETLPLRGWAAGIYDVGMHQVELDLNAAKTAIQKDFDKWKTLVTDAWIEGVL